MNRDDFQILRFEIQGLGKRFAAQIIPHADELDAAITKADGWNHCEPTDCHDFRAALLRECGLEDRDGA